MFLSSIFDKKRSQRQIVPTTRRACFMSLQLIAMLSPLLFSLALQGQYIAPVSLAEFERRAALSKELGATHMLVTDGLPMATWQMDPDDPYPMWFVHHAGLLTIFPPQDVAPYVDKAYAANVSGVLKTRCEILHKYGLKGVWHANEPAVMPESFFAAYPELRGPRIDQSNRSRKVYFAPSVDEPETLRMYRDAMQSLLATCPEVDEFNWTTTDAGSGFDWTPSLYPGVNGNSKYKNRPMADRVAGFLINLQQAAAASGHQIKINLRPIEPRPWMVPTFSPDVLREIVRELPAGIAVEDREGPDGHAFTGVATVRAGNRAFRPVVGIVVPPLMGEEDFWNSEEKPASEFMIVFQDSAGVDFAGRLLKSVRRARARTYAERIVALRAFAVSEVGSAQADQLMDTWLALNDAQLYLQTLDFGDMLYMGGVLNRWITRPMVPFPEELTADEKKNYRPFLFQAKGEDQAGNLADIQAMRMYEGWGAHLLFQRTVSLALARMQRALTLIHGIQSSAKDETSRAQWDLMGRRVQAVIDLMQTADDMVSYQAQLDRVKHAHARVEPNPVLGVQSSWDRTDLMETARKEIDTAIDLKHLLESTHAPILDTASTPQEENIMRLGPDIQAQLKQKIEIMNGHWRDYDRLFTKPNP